MGAIVMRTNASERNEGVPDYNVGMKISVPADGGNIEVLGDADDDEVALAIGADNAADFRQWFCFRSWGEAMERRAFRIENASKVEYPGAFEEYEVCASYDGEDWFRVSTAYEEGALSFEHVPERRSITFAAFAPYSLGRQNRLIGRASRSGLCKVETLGETVLERPIRALTFGNVGPHAARIWMIARQHPGETMASWCAEGLVDQLLNKDDPVTAALLEEAAITIVPCVNMDGGVLGNHRTNARGRDLNRAWDAPDLEETPEVFAVRSAIIASGVDLFLDIHGDETARFSFAAACEGNPSYSERIADLEDSFLRRLEMLDPSFSLEPGYDRDAPGEADLSCAANWVGERFDCLSLTIELPFKNVVRRTTRRNGGARSMRWTPGASALFGRSLLQTTLLTLETLR